MKKAKIDIVNTTDTNTFRKKIDKWKITLEEVKPKP